MSENTLWTCNEINGVLVVFCLENYTKYFDGCTCWLSCEGSFPFGVLVYHVLCDIRYPFQGFSAKSRVQTASEFHDLNMNFVV